MAQATKDRDERKLLGVLKKVENTKSLIHTEVAQLGNLSEVLNQWGHLIKVTRVMRRAVLDSEQWVNEINGAIQAMRKRTVFAARKLRAIIASYEKNNRGANH